MVENNITEPTLKRGAHDFTFETEKITPVEF